MVEPFNEWMIEWNIDVSSTLYVRIFNFQFGFISSKTYTYSIWCPMAQWPSPSLSSLCAFVPSQTQRWRRRCRKCLFIDKTPFENSKYFPFQFYQIDPNRSTALCRRWKSAAISMFELKNRVEIPAAGSGGACDRFICSWSSWIKITFIIIFSFLAASFCWCCCCCCVCVWVRVSALSITHNWMWTNRVR